MSEPHVAILVLNRNMREMTEKLIDTIRATTKVPHTIFSLDAASDVGQIALGGDVIVRFDDNHRWAWSFAEGMSIACTMAHNKHVDWRKDGLPVGGWNIATSLREVVEPTHFWLLCNDTQLDPTRDTLKVLLENMPKDACQIHPYQTTHPRGSPQGQHAGTAATIEYYREKGILDEEPILLTHMVTYHNVAFVEFVCPLITRSFYDSCLERFGCSPVGPHFPYGWGVDYEMAYFGHSLGLKSYICDAVGITHHPGTTHENHEKTKVEDNNKMRILARNSMLDVLEARYGRSWGETFTKAAVDIGVDPKAFLEWSQHDRALAAGGLRVS